MKGVIFDFDGTLVDTLPDIAEAVNVGRKAFGLAECPVSDVRDWIGEGMPSLCQKALGQSVNTHLEEMVSMVTSYYREHCLDETILFPGISELLDCLAEREVPMAILSNKPHEHTVAMAEALLGRWSFVAVEGYQVEQRRKPEPSTALEILARMQLEPSEVMMVGDSATDMATAGNAGLLPVGVTWGYRSREQLIDAGAVHLIDRAEDLLALI